MTTAVEVLEAAPEARKAVPSEGRFTEVVFSGRADEYFGIWFVNLLLSILTLGIWSAWAKVRRLKWLYGHTSLDGHSLDYHGEPIKILIGRIIVVAGIAAFAVLQNFYPLVGGLVTYVIAAFVVPWLVNRALSFHMRMTSWRTVRFSFKGSYARAFFGFVILPVLAVFSLGLLLPVMSRYIRHYVLSGLSYGGKRFTAEIPLAPLYGALLKSLGIVAAFAVVIGGLAFLMWDKIRAARMALEIALTQANQGLIDEAEVVAYFLELFLVIALLLALLYLSFFIAAFFYRAQMRNVALSNLVLEGGHRFHSRLNGFRVAWIKISNFFLIILSLGLFIPGAQVRQHRYLCRSTAVTIAGNPEAYVSEAAAAGGSLGSEAADIQGLGFDFGI